MIRKPLNCYITTTNTGAMVNKKGA